MAGRKTLTVKLRSSVRWEVKIECAAWSGMRSRSMSVRREATWGLGRWNAFSFICYFLSSLVFPQNS